jgi:hypothetical protein
MALDTTTFDAMLKDHYAPGMVENIGFDECPGIALVKKSRGSKHAGGRRWIQPVGTRLPNQGSSTFATANAVTTNQSTHDAFEVFKAAHYRKVLIQNQVIYDTLDDIDAFEPALEETQKGMKAEANWANFRLYRSRGGAIGRMTNTAFATAVMTVDDAAALHAVATGDVLKLASTDGTSGAVRAGSLTVASVQHGGPDAVSTITLTGNISAGVAAAAANDFVFLDGDFGLAPAGFADYVPDTAAAAATTLFGFDRSLDSRLGGVIIQGGSLTIRETIMNMLTAHKNADGVNSGRTKVLFGNPYAFNTLAKQSDDQWSTMKAVGFDNKPVIGVDVAVYQIKHLGTTLNIVMDRMCPEKRLYMMNIDQWTMFHSNGFPFFLTDRINILKVSETADAFECRIGGYLNFCTAAPHTNVVGILQ